MKETTDFVDFSTSDETIVLVGEAFKDLDSPDLDLVRWVEKFREKSEENRNHIPGLRGIFSGLTRIKQDLLLYGSDDPFVSTKKSIVEMFWNEAVLQMTIREK